MRQAAHAFEHCLAQRHDINLYTVKSIGEAFMFQKSISVQTIFRAAALAAAGLSLSACAYVSQHPDGSAAIVGIAAVTMQQTPGAPPGAVTVRSHGLTLSDKPPAQGLVLGVYDQPMQFGAPAANPHHAARHGQIDFVERTRMSNGGHAAEHRRVVKRVKYRKMRRCNRCGR
jgi:hypothetical protein